jgi:hypothetical protein
MLVLLMLIASRLTWLQTSEISANISSTFYRSGLWFNDHSAKYCVYPPEATFPVPAAMAIDSQSHPPPPAAGELSLGLVALMTVRCQWERLGVENFAHWNAWIFMGTTLFSAFAVRLITRSWTAGLLAAVAVLSRGTLQNKATMATSEPYASMLVAASWVFFVAYLRSLWRSWLGFALLSWCVAVLFVPALWASFLIFTSAPLLLAIPQKEDVDTKWISGPFDNVQFSQLHSVLPRHNWVYISTGVLLVAWCLAKILSNFDSNSLPFYNILRELWASQSSRQDFLASFSSARDMIALHSQSIDWHAWLTLALICVQPMIGAPNHALSRVAAIFFCICCTTQIGFSVLAESFLIQRLSQTPLFIIPSARTLEPIFIAWGTGSAWLLLDRITGFRLSSSGWSIRGRGRITPYRS